MFHTRFKDEDALHKASYIRRKWKGVLPHAHALCIDQGTECQREPVFIFVLEFWRPRPRPVFTVVVRGRACSLICRPPAVMRPGACKVTARDGRGGVLGELRRAYPHFRVPPPATVCSPGGAALWGRGPVGRVNAGLVITPHVPIEVTERGYVGFFVVKDPAAGLAAPVRACVTRPAAAIAVRVPVEPAGHAVRFVVGCAGEGGALLRVGDRRRAACYGGTASRDDEIISGGAPSQPRREQWCGT